MHAACGIIAILLSICIIHPLHAQPHADGVREEARDSVVERDARAPVTNWLTIHPLKAWFGLPYTASSIATIGYYREIIPHLAAGLGLSVVEWNINQGAGASFDLRYYSRGVGIGGPYVALDASYRYIDEDASKTYTLGCIVGWQWFPDRHFTANVGFGYDYYFRHAPPLPPGVWNENPILAGDMPAIQCEVGYTW